MKIFTILTKQTALLRQLSRSGSLEAVASHPEVSGQGSFDSNFSGVNINKPSAPQAPSLSSHGLPDFASLLASSVPQVPSLGSFGFNNYLSSLPQIPQFPAFALPNVNSYLPSTCLPNLNSILSSVPLVGLPNFGQLSIPQIPSVGSFGISNINNILPSLPSVPQVV